MKGALTYREQPPHYSGLGLEEDLFDLIILVLECLLEVL